MENSHKINFNMGHIENIVGYLETTSKYLHFACGTFLKMSKKWTQISGYVHFLNIPGFFLSNMGSPSKMPLAISSGPSFYIGFGFLISKYSIPGPFSLRFCHYFCNKFSPSSWLARESGYWAGICTWVCGWICLWVQGGPNKWAGTYTPKSSI